MRQVSFSYICFLKSRLQSRVIGRKKMKRILASNIEQCLFSSGTGLVVGGEHSPRPRPKRGGAKNRRNYGLFMIFCLGGENYGSKKSLPKIICQKRSLLIETYYIQVFERIHCRRRQFNVHRQAKFCRAQWRQRTNFYIPDKEQGLFCKEVSQ